jgi:hypothetical protein
MSKTQRELLILGGILATLAVVLVMRGRGSSGTRPANAARQSSASTQATTPGGTTTPGNQAVDPTSTELMRQYPIAMLVPTLSDSAVAARIRAATVPNPFAENRGRVTRPQQAPVRRPQRPTQPRTRPTIDLTDWPAGVRFNILAEVPDSPGVWRASFSGRPVNVGEKIRGTEFVLVDATAAYLIIRAEFADRIEVFRYVVPPSTDTESLAPETKE